MRESMKNEIILDSWLLISKFIYSGNIHIDGEHAAFEIVKFAHQYEMKVLMILFSARRDWSVVYICGKNAVDRLVLGGALGLQSHNHTITF